MNKVKILADSVSDLTQETAEKWGVEIIPLTINFNGESYRDFYEINAGKLFELMKGNKEFPTTSQVTPAAFYEVFKKYTDEGYDVVLITMTEKLSGTHQSSVIAAGAFPEGRVYTVDSMNVTAGEYLLVKMAVKMRDEGKSAAEIAQTLNDAKYRIRSCVAFETLENLIRSGRISKTAGFVGGMLGIKPTAKVENGELIPTAKERGTKKALAHILSSLKKERPMKFPGVVLAHSDQKEGLKILQDELKERNIPYEIIEIGGVTASHVGPHACAYFLIEEKE